MRTTCLFECLQKLALAFYYLFSKIRINVHQLFAYWRNRIQVDQRFVSSSQASITNVELTPQVLIGEELRQQVDSSNNNSVNSIDCLRQQQIGASLTIKTPHSRRFKLTSIFRRLSLRNFMDYCVSALNEASNSGCSNKFDLSSCDKPVWLLGQKYELPEDGEKLLDDTRSKLWITYRRNFPPIDENTRYTTDRGFGCMIRCGQMVLANALLYKNLGRNWRWTPGGLDTNPNVYTKILKLFQDRADCIYSIHNIVRTGQHEGKNIGEWFGPNTIAQALKRISSTMHTTEPADNEILISIEAALDNVVVIDEVKSKFKHTIGDLDEKNGSDDLQSTQGNDGDKLPHSEKQSQWMPGILFIQLRLGLTKINPLYFEALKKTFHSNNSLGIIGGRPNHALYLIGYTGEDIIYLDPHSTQQYVNLDETNNNSGNELDEQSNVDNSNRSLQPPDDTYHCSCPEKMSMDRLDPSLALCFYFSSENDFDNWCSWAQESLIKSEQAPMFEIAKSRPSDWNIPIVSKTVKGNKKLDESIELEPACDSHSNASDHDEEFEMLA